MIVTTCMGRVDQLSRSLPTWLSSGQKVMIVEWVNEDDDLNRLAYESDPELVHVVHGGTPGEAWNPSKARNFGASFAPRGETLWFLDADVSLRGVLPSIPQGQFGICCGPPIDLDGVLAVTVDDFHSVNGYDLDLGRFNSYETVDIKLKLRIFLFKNYVKLDGLFFAEQHNDSIREQNMSVSLKDGHDAAWRYMQDKWGRLPLTELEIEELSCRVGFKSTSRGRL